MLKLKKNQGFYDHIEDVCSRGGSIMDAVMDFSEKNNTDPEICASWIRTSPELKSKFESYAKEHYLLKNNEATK